KAAGAKVIVLDINRARLDFCQSQFAVDAAILAGADPVPAMQAATGGNLPTAVLDATGNPASMHAAFKYAAPSGRIVFVGLFIGDVTFHDPDFHRKELTLLATRNALPADFQNIIRLMETKVINTAPWITHRAAA